MTAKTQPVATLSAKTGGTPQAAMTNPAIARPAARGAIDADHVESGSRRELRARYQLGDHGLPGRRQHGLPGPDCECDVSSSAGGIMPKAVRTASRVDTVMK